MQLPWHNSIQAYSGASEVQSGFNGSVDVLPVTTVYPSIRGLSIRQPECFTLALGRSGNQMVCGSPRSSAVTSQSVDPSLHTSCVPLSASLCLPRCSTFSPYSFSPSLVSHFFLDDCCHICAWAIIPLQFPHRTSKKRQSLLYSSDIDIFSPRIVPNCFRVPRLDTPPPSPSPQNSDDALYAKD